MIISRTETFSAAHRLHSPHLSDQENQALYGKCNNLHGHGHNYRLEVLIEGPVDERTGMVMNLVDLNGLLRERVLDLLDHRHLDYDVGWFATRPSTTENVARFIWEQLRGKIPTPARLLEVRLWETDKNTVYYRGPE